MINTEFYILIFIFTVFFESVKSELRKGSSVYSDISDSEESEPDCTTQVCLEKVNKAIQDNSVHFKFIWEITKYLMQVQGNISNSTLLSHS